MKVEISDKIKYIGVDDTTLDLFESQYVIHLEIISRHEFP